MWIHRSGCRLGVLNMTIYSQILGFDEALSKLLEHLPTLHTLRICTLCGNGSFMRTLRLSAGVVLPKLEALYIQASVQNTPESKHQLSEAFNSFVQDPRRSAIGASEILGETRYAFLKHKQLHIGPSASGR